MTTFPKTLKDPRTCRVFVSSPFGGCELEREELVRKYFPQLSHICQSKGVQFVAVDMRWGITEEAATDAQVIKICLKEVDRSDIFVGFYGQRYGWHGSSDETLQRNMENAEILYPWVADVKDRSVTEIEFLHGHLNNPGALPAIFAFRDKSYDDIVGVKAHKSKDDKTAIKYKAESESAKLLLENLKRRVIHTKCKCLALKEKYPTPQEGASFIFEEIKKHLETVLLKSHISISKRDLDLARHNAYLMSRVSVFVGRTEYEKRLNLALETGGQHVVIVGATGSGKGALLAHWLKSLLKEKRSLAIIYHFMGCSSDSASTPEILLRLITEMKYLAGDIKKERSDGIQNLDDELKPKPKEVTDMFRELELVLTRASARHNILVAIDGLGKVQKMWRTAKTLFWLPRHLPQNVTVVCTCRETDRDIIEELQLRGYTLLQIPELNPELRQQMCTQLLSHNSKELSTQQLQKIVECKQSGSPLYLKSVVSELCSFGQYRELDAKIDELINCKCVKALFEVFIRRLEADYNNSYRTGNLTEKVLCSIRVSRKGLSEHELMSMHQIPSKEWSPLFFAIQHVIVEMAGLIKFGFNELAEAVDDRYFTNKGTRLKYQKIVAEYFDKQRKARSDYIRLDDPSLMRPADELPWLLRDMGATEKLKEVLADLPILGRLFLDQELELLELWRCTGLSGEQTADLYLRSVRSRAQQILAANGETDGNALITLISYLNVLSYFMEMASYRAGQEKILLAEMDILEKASKHMPADALKRSKTMIEVKLAYLYTDTGRYEKAAELHENVLQYRQEHLKMATSEDQQKAALKALAGSYHGIAMLNSKLDKITEAIEYYTKAMEVQKLLDDEVELADSLHNLGVMYMKIGKHQQALDLCTTSLKIYQDVYFANLPPVIGVMIGNIAVCYRHLGQVNEAEAMYNKALDIAEKALGRQHPHVALGLMNLATLEINRQQFVKAESYIRECVHIFHKCETLENDADYFKSLEKFVYVLLKVNKVPEAIELFQKLIKIAVKEKFLDTSWPNVYILMVDCLIDLKQFRLALDVTMELMNSQQVQDKSYIHYHTICEALNLSPNLDYSLEHALKMRPGSLILLHHTFEKIFLPEDALDKAVKSLDEADRSLKIGADLYGTAVTWCEKANRPALALGLLEHAAELFPDEANFLCGLTQYYYENKNWEKVKEYSGRLSKLDPENANHFLMHGDMARRADDFVLADLQ
ncbi:hypothetical protein BsWGS_10837 [Bradybaena similaris]